MLRWASARSTPGATSRFNFKGADQQKNVGISRAASETASTWRSCCARRQPPAARRADERPRRGHAAGAGGSDPELRRLRRRDQPRPLVPGPRRDAHPGLRGRGQGGLVRGQLPRVRSGPKKRLGAEADRPHRLRFKRLKSAAADPSDAAAPGSGAARRSGSASTLWTTAWNSASVNGFSRCGSRVSSRKRRVAVPMTSPVTNTIRRAPRDARAGARGRTPGRPRPASARRSRSACRSPGGRARAPRARRWPVDFVPSSARNSASNSPTIRSSSTRRARASRCPGGAPRGSAP